MSAAHLMQIRVCAIQVQALCVLRNIRQLVSIQHQGEYRSIKGDSEDSDRYRREAEGYSKIRAYIPARHAATVEG